MIRGSLTGEVVADTSSVPDPAPNPPLESQPTPVAGTPAVVAPAASTPVAGTPAVAAQPASTPATTPAASTPVAGAPAVSAPPRIQQIGGFEVISKLGQ